MNSFCCRCHQTHRWVKSTTSIHCANEPVGQVQRPVTLWQPPITMKLCKLQASLQLSFSIWITGNRFNLPETKATKPNRVKNSKFLTWAFLASPITQSTLDYKPQLLLLNNYLIPCWDPYSTFIFCVFKIHIQKSFTCFKVLQKLIIIIIINIIRLILWVLLTLIWLMILLFSVTAIAQEMWGYRF